MYIDATPVENLTIEETTETEEITAFTRWIEAVQTRGDLRISRRRLEAISDSYANDEAHRLVPAPITEQTIFSVPVARFNTFEPLS
jgi:hypothetical protein